MAIIGISGKIGSGKDTVGMIIQTHMAKQSLPDLRVEEVIKDPSEYSAIISAISTYKIKKFAGKLKQVASILTGIPIEKFEDQEVKKTFLPEVWNNSDTEPEDWCVENHWEKWKVFILEKKNATIKLKDIIAFARTCGWEDRMTVRDFLQRLGTEGLRDGLHPNTWVNALMADYNPGPFFPEVPAEDHAKLPNWIITDTRFENEAQAIKDRLGIVIRVENKNITSTQSHPSETALDNWEFDYVIDNSGSIEELSDKVYDMLRHFDIIPSPAAND
jgi:hypothetical protein